MSERRRSNSGGIPMAASVFSGLSYVRHDGQIAVAYPNGIHDIRRAAAVAQPYGLAVQSSGAAAWTLHCPAPEGGYPPVLKTFFADLNDLPAPYPAAVPDGFVPGPPLVSCIVVVNENLPFVCEQLLPSLQANTRKVPIEIIIVCNGSPGDVPQWPNVRAIQSEWGSVSKAYNAGARASRGRYLAIFHDDCTVCDPLWVEKCLQRLERGAQAVAGEFREINTIAGVGMLKLPVAKCVPLFLGRDDFDAVGGFDEFHYIGYEDLDFTLALASHGKKLVATDLRIQHFHGMSSTLKYNPLPGLAELYAFTALPRVAIMQRFKEFWSGGMAVDGVDYLQVATDVQLLHVLAKYRDFLGRAGNPAYARAQAALEQALAAACPDAPGQALSRFREIDRKAWESRAGRT